MDDPLATYLHDHVSGATHAVELLQKMRERLEREPLGVFAAQMLVEVQADRDVLRELTSRIGGGSGNPLKEMTGWLAEKASRIKLGGDSHSLGSFEALEYLQIGIRGKWALWRALEQIVAAEPRLAGVDFRSLAARAEAQEAKVDAERLKLSESALRPGVARRAGA
jgi:hypothetical protein